jgi:Bacterial Ig-like domain (group 3)
MITKTARGALLLFVLLRFSIPASADRPTNIALSPAAGTFGGTTTLQATLTSTGRPVPNQTISFALNDTPVGSATTNSNGVAILANVSLVGIAANTYSKGVTAIFAGTADLRSSQRTATLTVNQLPL